MDIGITYTRDDIAAIYKTAWVERTVPGTNCGHYMSAHLLDAMRRLILGFLTMDVPYKDVRLCAIPMHTTCCIDL